MENFFADVQSSRYILSASRRISRLNMDVLHTELMGQNKYISHSAFTVQS